MHDDRLSNIVAEYLEGHLELETAVAQLTHVYVEHGWGFYLVEAECRPEHRERMRALASRVEEAMGAVMTSRQRSSGRGTALSPGSIAGASRATHPGEARS